MCIQVVVCAITQSKAPQYFLFNLEPVWSLHHDMFRFQFIINGKLGILHVWGIVKFVLQLEFISTRHMECCG